MKWIALVVSIVLIDFANAAAVGQLVPDTKPNEFGNRLNQLFQNQAAPKVNQNKQSSLDEISSKLNTENEPEKESDIFEGYDPLRPEKFTRWWIGKTLLEEMPKPKRVKPPPPPIAPALPIFETNYPPPPPPPPPIEPPMPPKLPGQTAESAESDKQEPTTSGPAPQFRQLFPVPPSGTDLNELLKYLPESVAKNYMKTQSEGIAHPYESNMRHEHISAP